MRISLYQVFLANLIVLAGGNLALAFNTEVLRNGGPVAKRINLVILGDGYTAAETQKLHDDAVAMLDAIFSIEPLADYPQFYNVTLVYVISNQSGADHPELATSRDTALDAYYECSPGVVSLLCVNASSALIVAADHVPDFDQVIVMVNDDTFGWSGGMPFATSRNIVGFPGLPARVVHEMAHSMANLADEFQTPYAGFPVCSASTDCTEPNVTLRTDLQDIKWNHWFDVAVPLPTPVTVPYLDVVGLFEGARYLDSDIYRPAADCRMRSYDAEFCAVCMEAMILALYRQVSPLDGWSPASDVDLLIGEQRTLSLTRPVNQSGSLGVTWTIDGALQAAATANDLIVSGAALGGGTHHVTAEVHDSTVRVRSDPMGLRDAAVSWTIEVTGCGDGIAQAQYGEQCDAANDGSYAGCNANCTLAPYCGNGIVDGPEACDGGDTCTSECALIAMPAPTGATGATAPTSAPGTDMTDPSTGEGSMDPEPSEASGIPTKSDAGRQPPGGCNSAVPSPLAALLVLALLARSARLRPLRSREWSSSRQ